MSCTNHPGGNSIGYNVIRQVTDYDGAGADNTPLADAYTITCDTTNTDSRAPSDGYSASEVDTRRKMDTVPNHTIMINAGACVNNDGNTEPGCRVHYAGRTKHRTGTNVRSCRDNCRGMHSRNESESRFECNIGDFKSGFAVANAKGQLINSAPCQFFQFFLTTDNDSSTK